MAPDLKPKQVAERMQLDKATVYALISQGTLPAYNTNPNGLRPRWRVRVADLERFIQKYKTAMVGTSSHND